MITGNERSTAFKAGGSRLATVGFIAPAIPSNRVTPSNHQLFDYSQDHLPYVAIPSNRVTPSNEIPEKLRDLTVPKSQSPLIGSLRPTG